MILLTLSCSPAARNAVACGRIYYINIVRRTGSRKRRDTEEEGDEQDEEGELWEDTAVDEEAVQADERTANNTGTTVKLDTTPAVRAADGTPPCL